MNQITLRIMNATTKNLQKVYKVMYKPYETTKFEYTHIAMSLKEAKEYVKSYTGFSARIIRKPLLVKYHHTGSDKGYIKKNGGYTTYYNGRFGEGYKEIIPNVQGSPKGSNNYYFVKYYIAVK